MNLTSSYAAKYDAWNRLVELKSGMTTVATFAYDDLNRRTTQTASGVTRHYYYSDSWQVLEERLDSDSVPDRQFVWGLRYVDDLVLRERFGVTPETSESSTSDSASASSSSSSGEEVQRLYALQDANWNVVAAVDDAASVVQRFGSHTKLR